MNEIVQDLTDLYREMQKAYDQTSLLLDFSCDDCPDNCCDSYFLHHTYIEWAGLIEGFNALPEEAQKKYLARAKEYVAAADEAIAKEERPSIMCPLNDDGKCGLYDHRLMICRLHGVPASMTGPDGSKRQFPGCFRCQEKNDGKQNTTAMDRTLFFRKMVYLEDQFVGRSRMSVPRVKMTIAEMLLKGAPDMNF